MKNLNEEILTGDIKLSMSLTLASKWLKIALAIVIVFAYFSDADWLIEVIVLSVVLSLILPLGFFDVFIQKLLKYNIRKVEEQQTLNANEANKHFDNLYKKFDK